MTIVVKKVPKAFRGIVKFLFKIKEWIFSKKSSVKNYRTFNNI